MKPLLIIEDAPSIVKFLTIGLANTFEVISTPRIHRDQETGEEGGLDILDRKPIEVILLDLNLLDSLGLKTLQTVIDKKPEVPVVVTTGDESLLEACIHAGAQDFIPKMDLSDFRRVIAILLKSINRHKVRHIYTPLAKKLKEVKDIVQEMKQAGKE